ncbi:MAG: dTDP-4-dehydrorhamnose 3,5-epimerase [Humidesulfovibrio sp.]|nr:dTDP-4-dehydrorhamnose 3,5-epimerase [Humidesulfovibrio sp.]
MRLIETGLPGLVLLEPKLFRDERGFFLETYSRAAFAALGIQAVFVQDNHAYSAAPFVLRGLHFQRPPQAQAKLVWVVRGRVLDVAVDLRQGSPTFGRHFCVELSADNFLRLFIPRGFAHGYVTLAPDTEFMYKVDAPYDAASDAGILWNDPELGIPWPGCEPVLSTKDRVLPRLKDCAMPFVFEGPAAGGQQPPQA